MSIPNEPAIILAKPDTARVRNDSEENGKGLFFLYFEMISSIDCLEEKVQGKIRRVNLTRTTDSSFIGPVTSESDKSASPSRTNPWENQTSPGNTVSSQSSKTNSPYIALETDMDVRSSPPYSSFVSPPSFISVSNRKNIITTI